MSGKGLQNIHGIQCRFDLFRINKLFPIVCGDSTIIRAHACAAGEKMPSAKRSDIQKVGLTVKSIRWQKVKSEAEMQYKNVYYLYKIYEHTVFPCKIMNNAYRLV